ncbi:hypothetical protein HL658_20725 [Azospirillum sp. RWY-5-1]|uniref:Uncharacterized protein n=1 Tax=Azospirillum oleiclasticum TaxID=2735135 RepID=A0ABX2TEI0_9PROT|nr:hypothetical protein [Azospirillum oleiclasticum]NYZ14978.1 hypothetical protein [Azospirillum oleiclasticum]NYZ22740.1 hypothetical protein [Azospirillum oleiclasticum]
MNILETLGTAVQGAMNLRVITLVGDAAVTGKVESPTVEMPAAGPAMVTNINLAGGDISTIMSQPFVDAGYADLRTLHNDMVAKAQSVVERNVTMLKDLADWLAGKDLPTPPSNGG